MSLWHAKVHKTGSKVAVFNGSNLVQVVEASNDTFQPAEAQKFAEELVKELSERTSSQMSNGSEQPSVTTETELHQETVEAVGHQAEGKGANETSTSVSVTPEIPVVSNEQEDVEKVVTPETDEKIASITSENEKLKKIIATYQKKLSNEQKQRILERKARRGLAIAKQMVIEGSLEDTYDAIKNKVAEISKLEESEIDRLERKAAKEPEFDSIEDAQKEFRRQSRLVRIHRLAAAEAQEDKDEEQADVLDAQADAAEAKAAYINDVINQMKTAEPNSEVKVEPSAETKPEVKEEEVEEKTAAEEVKVEPSTETKPEVKEEEKVEEKTAAEENPQMILAKNYRLIASTHRKNAEAAEAAGDIAKADAEDSKADIAEEQAEEIENKLAAENCKSTEKVEETENNEEPEDNEESTENEEESEESSKEEEKKQASRRTPGKVASKPDYSPLKREGETVDEFGIDKNASLVEQNDYATDPEVEILSKMWKGAPLDDE